MFGEGGVLRESAAMSGIFTVIEDQGKEDMCTSIYTFIRTPKVRFLVTPGFVFINTSTMWHQVSSQKATALAWNLPKTVNSDFSAMHRNEKTRDYVIQF